jgi:hypothetical protein
MKLKFLIGDRASSLVISFLALGCFGSAWSQVPQIGGYNVYYGSLHNHCEISDGTGSARDAYQTAKNVAQLDFFSLSDHAEFMTDPEWLEMKAAADLFDEPDVFTALWGFEWSSVVYGHLTVTGSAGYASSLSSGTDNFGEMNKWLDNCGCVAFLNHPGDYDGFGMEFRHFRTRSSPNIVGMELWNGTSGFERYFYNDGYTIGDGGLGYYDEALVRGWRTGASGACDIHGGNWGSGVFRLAVLANRLDRENLMEAFRSRRFYSTLDMNLEMSFKVQGNEMGSIMNPGQYQAEVLLHDADQEVFTRVELVRKGQVVNTFSLSEPDPVLFFEITADASDCYYVIVTQEDGDQAISSPVFISNTVIPTGNEGANISSTDAWTVRYLPGEKLNVCIPSQTPEERICMADVSGRLLLYRVPVKGPCFEIPLTGLQPGIYILFAPDHAGWGSHKVAVW